MDEERFLRRRRVLPRINTRPSRPVLIFVGRMEDLENAVGELRQRKSFYGKRLGNGAGNPQP